MNIKIEKIIKDKVIEISSHLGNLIVTSLSKKMEEGKIYSVEFDIIEHIQLGENAKKTRGDIQPVQHKNSINEIPCIVESIDENDMCLRLAADCIIMAVCEDNNIKEGDYLLLNINVDTFQMSIIGYPAL